MATVEAAAMRVETATAASMREAAATTNSTAETEGLVRIETPAAAAMAMSPSTAGRTRTPSSGGSEEEGTLNTPIRDPSCGEQFRSKRNAKTNQQPSIKELHDITEQGRIIR